MSNLSQFIGSPLLRPPISIVNYYSSGGASITKAVGYGSKTILSGALTAGVLKELLNISGAGVLLFLSAAVMDTTSRQITLKLTIDGTVVFNAQTEAITVAGRGPVAVGSVDAAANKDIAYESVPFNESLVVQVASTLSETDMVAIYVRYWLV